MLKKRWCVIKFEKYSRESIYLIDGEMPAILHMCLHSIRPKIRRILDLWCDNGSLLFAPERSGLLKDTHILVGLDLSLLRIERLRCIVKRAEGFVADGCRTCFKTKTFDFSIYS